MPVYVPDYMKATIFISSTKKGGWSESFLINSIDYAAAKTKLATICDYRSAILAAEFEITHATVSKSLIKGDSAVPADYEPAPVLLAAEVSIETCNNPGVGLLYRFDTGTGKHSNRIIRGVRDGWILNNAAQFGSAYITVFTGVGSRPAFGTAMGTALDAFIKTVAANTVFIVDRDKLDLDPAPDPSERFEAVPWNRVQFRKVAQRDTGPGFSAHRGRRRHTV